MMPTNDTQPAPDPRSLCSYLTANRCCNITKLPCPVLEQRAECLHPDPSKAALLRDRVTSGARQFTQPASAPSQAVAALEAFSSSPAPSIATWADTPGLEALKPSPERRSALKDARDQLERKRSSAQSAQDFYQSLPTEYLETINAPRLKTRPKYGLEATIEKRDVLERLIAEENLRELNGEALNVKIAEIVAEIFSADWRALIGNGSAVRLTRHLIALGVKARLEGTGEDVYIVTTARQLAFETGLSLRTVHAVLSNGKTSIGRKDITGVWWTQATLYDGRREDGLGGSSVGVIIRVKVTAHSLEHRYPVPAVPTQRYDQARWELRAHKETRIQIVADAEIQTQPLNCKKTAGIESIPSKEETALLPSLVLPDARPTATPEARQALFPAIKSNNCKPPRGGSEISPPRVRDERAERLARAAMLKLGDKDGSFYAWYGAFRRALEGGSPISEQQIFAIVSDALELYRDGRLRNKNPAAYAIGTLTRVGVLKPRAQHALVTHGSVINSSVLETTQVALA